MKFHWILLFSALLLSGCFPPPKDQEPKRGLTGRNLNDWEKNSCAVGFEQGGAYSNNIGRPQRVTTYFDKVYDSAQVYAILGASAKNMVDYIQRHGVELLGVHKPSRGCHNLTILPHPGAELVEHWNSIDRGGISGPFVIGFFIPESMAWRYRLKKPIIMVRTDADRWTLVHEFMHYLFSKERMARGFDEDVFLGEWEVVQSFAMHQFQQIDEDKLKSDIQYSEQLIRLWIEYAEMLPTYLRLFALEELTIEATLLQLYQNGRFENTTSYNRINSVAYIEANFVRAMDILGFVQKVGEKISSSVLDPENGGRYEKFNKLRKSLIQLETTTRKVYGQTVRTATGGPSVSNHGRAAHYGCSRWL